MSRTRCRQNSQGSDKVGHEAGEARSRFQTQDSLDRAGSL